MRKRSRIMALTAALSSICFGLSTTPALAAVPHTGNIYCGSTLNPVNNDQNAVFRHGNNTSWNYNATWCSSFVQAGSGIGMTAYYTSTNLAGTSSTFTLNGRSGIDGPIYFERFMYLSVYFGLMCTATPTLGSRALGDGDHINIHLALNNSKSPHQLNVDQAVLVYSNGATEVIAITSTCNLALAAYNWAYPSTIVSVTGNNWAPYTEWVFDDIHGDEWTNGHWIYTLS